MSTTNDVPVDFKVESITDSTVELTWSPLQAKDESISYQISMRKTGGFLFNRSVDNHFITKETSYTVKNLEQWTEYEFWIQSGYVGKWGKPSEKVLARTIMPLSWNEYNDSEDPTRKKYMLNRKNPRIVTMTDEYSKSTITGNTPIPLDKVTSWSISILKSRENNGFGIFVGVAPEGIVQDEENPTKSGWYFDCYDSTLSSGSPHSYRNKEYGPRKDTGAYVRNDDVIGVVMDATKGELSFSLNGESLGVAYEGIPLDKPLVPCVILKWKDDTVEISYSGNESLKSGGLRIGGAGKDAHCDLSSVYPQDYEKVTLKDALLKAGFTEKQADDICTACNNKAQELSEDGKLSEEFTADDAAAIAMYTFDFGTGDFEANPSSIINKAIGEKRTDDLEKASDLIYLLMTALRKLPRITGMCLYRCVGSEIDIDEYRDGETITWPALSSASPDIHAVRKFLGKTSDGKPSGTMFTINYAWGYDIHSYSLYPDDYEIILEPGMSFKVSSVIKDDIFAAKLNMLDSKLVLPQVFGEGKSK